MFASGLTGFILGMGSAGLICVFAVVFHIVRDCGDL